MVRKLTLVLCCFIFIVVNSCKKKNDAGFTVTNTNDVDLNVTFYASESDYKNGVNAVLTGTAPRNGAYNFSASKLKAGNWYYVDVYSNDYTYTNWVNDDAFIIGLDSTTPRRFKYTGAENSYNIVYMPSATTARVSLLSNNKENTNWIAVDAVDLVDGSDIWYSLSTTAQFARIVIQKNDTGMYYYALGPGDTVVTQFTFGAITGYPEYTLIPNEYWLLFSITSTSVNPDPGVSLYQPATIDSVVALINGNLYILAKK